MAKRKKRAFRKYIKQDTYFTILREARPLRNRKIIKLFGVRLIHKIKLDKEDIYTLNRIQKWMDRALRPIEVWKPPKSRDSKSILIHLIKYLYARYEMPDFMINVWFEKASQYQFWFLELGKGANIRNLDIPLTYTKKMSHFFMEAPADLSVGHALRWGQILGMGGDDHLAREILKGRLGESFKDDTFWSTVIQFFINQSDLDINLVNRVITYIHTQKFEPRRYYINENEHVDEPPPHPGFSMKGRTLTALLNEMRTRGYLNWRKSYLEINKIWPGFPVPDYDVPSADEDENVYCRIEQITTARDLFYEGMMMRHCVASYKYNCVTQKLSIWSYRQYQDDKFQRLLTLAIDSQGKLLEVKGKHNSAPKRKELRIIREWLDSESFHGLKTYND
ncbi:MAG: PcfJ domain-containing protein [Bacteroidetes bacterium]|nr:PcfJ domain-containing protein [Bacteroidota bacterium]MCB0851501.1 PcfJ domain-containing protein [Bacteroidota bacterium]